MFVTKPMKFLGQQKKTTLKISQYTYIFRTWFNLKIDQFTRARPECRPNKLSREGKFEENRNKGPSQTFLEKNFTVQFQINDFPYTTSTVDDTGQSKGYCPSS